jgi:hypothetical protein
MRERLLDLGPGQTFALGVVVILASYIIFVLLREMIQEPKFTAIMLSVIVGCVTAAFVVGELVVYVVSML